MRRCWIRCTLGGALAAAVCAQAAWQAGRLQAAAPMWTARAAHTATALADGNVLLVGGFTAEESTLAGAELFDAVRASFGPVAEPRERRQSHAATRLADGSVLITGGMNAGRQYLATAERFDPVKRTFSSAGQMTAARAGHEAVLLADGRVLLIGGVGTGWTFLASAEIYDPHTGTFSATGKMSEPRESHVAVQLRDGRVLVAGGHRGRRNDIVISQTAEIYDPRTGQFAPAGPMTVRRHKHDGVALDDGRVVILGGADERDERGVYLTVELFDPATAQFTPGGQMRLGRYKHRGTSFVLANGRILLAGGAEQAEEFDVRSGSSALAGGPARMGGQFSAAARLERGRVLITGGYGGGKGPRPAAWIYEPAAR